MHSRVFEIECKKGIKGMTEGINYDLPEWWTSCYPDWYEELDEEFLSLSFEDFKEYMGLDIVEELASIVNDKYSVWFYNPAKGEEICTLDEMLHRGGKYYLTGRVWDYHW